MLRLSDAARLASAKLRTRKVRLVMTILLTGVMFTVLSLGLTLMQSSIDSIKRFSSGGMSERFIIGYQPMLDYGAMPSYHDPSIELKKRIEAVRNKTIADKRAYAKELGIEYDEKSEPEIIRYSYEGDPGSLNFSSPAVDTVMEEMRNEVPFYPRERRDNDATSLGAKNIYTIEQMFPDRGTLSPMIDGKEQMAEAEKQPPKSKQAKTLQSGFEMPLTLVDEAVLDTYLLDNRELVDATPIIISYADAESLLGLPALAADASSDQQIARIKDLRQRASSIKFDVCYRNSQSQDLLQKAALQQEEIASQKKLSPQTYIEPSVLYKLPSADSCGAVTITKDGRSAAQKIAEEKQQKFIDRFSPTKAEPPYQTKITFNVVGLMPNKPDFNVSRVRNMLSGLINGSITYGGWIIPKQRFEASTHHQEYTSNIFKKYTEPREVSAQPSLYEFPDADTARKYIKAVTCQPDSANTKYCIKNYQSLTQPVGSSSLGIDELRKQITPIVIYAFIGTIVISAFILMLTISRTIADSRRESAVFRALGANRLSISQVYILYTLFLAALIAVFVITISLVLAGVLDARFADSLSSDARAIIVPRDLSIQFRLFMIDGRIILLVVLSIVASALLGSILPLIRNMRRNPIKDMRDE